jgi:probable rRNA maturation factor
MPVVVQNASQLLPAADIERLWQETRAYTQHEEADITVRFVTEAEIQQLNRVHRQKDKATNVLTFSYGDGVHDVAVCLTVAEREAQDRNMTLRDYTATVLVHGFLHAVGMDHEASAAAAEAQQQAERAILAKAGFVAAHL